MALLAGAQGHVSKDADTAVLVEAIRTVASGGSVFEESVKKEVVALLKKAPRAVAEPAREAQALSPQEERVMGLVVLGKTNKEIATALDLSEKTVKNYLYNVFQKMGVGRRAQAASLFDIKRLQQLTRR
jgi:DNA-binding NarL/FixJ family response regulator